MPGQPGLRLILAAHTLGDPPLFPPAHRTRQQRKMLRGRLSLCGVLDRPAGHGPGFRYSTANIAAASSGSYQPWIAPIAALRQLCRVKDDLS